MKTIRIRIMAPSPVVVEITEQLIKPPPTDRQLEEMLYRLGSKRKLKSNA